MKRSFLKLAAATLAGALISACGGTDSGDDQTPGTMVTVATRGGFSGLVLAATKAGLADELGAANSNLTLLAPTNDAFGLLSNQLGFRTIAEMVDALPASTLESILLYHLLPGSVSGPDLLAGGASQNTRLVQGATTLALAVDTSSGIRITDSIGRVGIVGLTDVPNDNGVFHVVDRVLLPPGLLTVLQTVQSNPERFQGLVTLEGLRGTFFRQTMFAEFEREVHARVDKGEAMTGEKLTRTYGEILRRYHGDKEGVVKIDDLYTIEWARIPHFYSSFYVFQYATSIAAGSLFADAILKGEPGARERYLKLLSSGGSDYPYELVKAAGVDLATPAPYAAVATRMNRIMDQIEAILARRGK